MDEEPKSSPETEPTQVALSLWEPQSCNYGLPDVLHQSEVSIVLSLVETNYDEVDGDDEKE